MLQPQVRTFLLFCVTHSLFLSIAYGIVARGGFRGFPALADRQRVLIVFSPTGVVQPSGSSTSCAAGRADARLTGSNRTTVNNTPQTSSDTPAPKATQIAAE